MKQSKTWRTPREAGAVFCGLNGNQALLIIKNKYEIWQRCNGSEKDIISIHGNPYKFEKIATLNPSVKS
jgi:hypothetical protein